MILKCLCCSVLLAVTAKSGEFGTADTSFVLDGKPLQIRSGEMHYSRIPKPEWGNRIRMAKAMGLNTISTYVFWNLHEIKRGEFDFTGDKDVAEFIRLCGTEGMHVIVRPGPYVCAEWDLGGLPGWLLAEPGIKLRSSDPRYLQPAETWMAKMGAILKPLEIKNGGPVLMVQIENEFGSFGPSEPAYLDAIQKALRSGGYSGEVFTSDGASEDYLQRGGRPSVLKAVNFGGGAKGAFEKLGAIAPKQPKFNAEFWVGWFDQWGKPHHVIRASDKASELRWMIQNEASFNLYMFHGGSTRALWTGANWEGGYRPTTCSYDYSAPLDESGRPTSSFFTFRSTMQRLLKGESFAEVPTTAPTASVGTITLTEQAPFTSTFGSGLPTTKLMPMESYGQSTGFIAYRTTLSGPMEGTFDLEAVKDRVYVLVDGRLHGISGRSKPGSLTVKIPDGRHELDLVVENMGRINYGPKMNEERKGLAGSVSFAGKELSGFSVVNMTMQSPPTGEFQSITDGKIHGSSTLYRGKFRLGSTADTWLDMRGFGRGVVWLNGRNLGRYWKAGPAQAIFVPGCWLKSGDVNNELIVLELESETPPLQIRTSKEAIWGN